MLAFPHVPLRFRVAFILAVCVPFATPVFGDEPPPAIRRLAEQRMKWKNGSLNWVRTLIEGESKSEMYFESRHAGKDVIMICRGDREGALARDANGAAPVLGLGPHITMIREGEVWRTLEASPHAEFEERDQSGPSGFDARRLGLAASIAEKGVEESLLISSPYQWTWTEDKDGDLLRISARSENMRFEWVLDPDRDYQPLRASYYESGVCYSECKSTLAKVDNEWYPKTVEYFRGGANGEMKPYRRVDVLDIRVNVPDLPTDGFTPDDIGIDNGVQIMRRDKSGKASFAMYAEGKLLDMDEYFKQRDAGKIKEGPKYSANMKRGIAMMKLRQSVEAQDDPARSRPAVLASKETEWERQTKYFIDLYQLDETQSQKAILQLDAAKSAAGRFATAHLAEMRKLDDEAIEIASLKEPERGERMQEWEKKCAKALEPLDKILDQQLVPALERIPTAAQREALAAKRGARKSTTQPANSTDSKPADSNSGESTRDGDAQRP